MEDNEILNDKKQQENISKKIVEIKQNLAPIISERSYRENHQELFTLASGKKSPYYFDLKQTLMDPVYLKMASQGLYLLMLQKLSYLPKAAGGLTMGADPLVYTISLLSADAGSVVYPLVVRKQTKDHGSKKRIEGRLSQIHPNDKIVLVDDVITTGGSTLQAYEVLKEAGHTIDSVFCVLDRKEGGAENFASHGIDLYPLFELEDFASK
ncbi:MAG: orotate phosphoribosyltransferase [Leptospirales bacterium]